MKRLPINFAAFDWICAESISLYTSELIRLLLSSVSSSLNTSNPEPLKPCSSWSHCSMFHRWCCMLWIMSCSKPSPDFFLPVLLDVWILISAVQRMLFQKSSGFWPCLQLVVKPLYLLWWSLLLIVDTSASWRVFFSWLDVVKGFFFTMERILRSSTTVVIRGRPGLFMLLSSPVQSFFLRMYQTVDLATPNVPAISLMDRSNSFQMQMVH